MSELSNTTRVRLHVADADTARAKTHVEYIARNGRVLHAVDVPTAPGDGLTAGLDRADTDLAPFGYTVHRDEPVDVDVPKRHVFKLNGR